MAAAAAANGPQPSLPPDDVVVAEILSRLPLRSIGAFRAVCRAWNAIASCPSADRLLAKKRAPAAAVTVVTRDATRLEVDSDDDGRRPVDIVRFDFFRGRWHPDVHRNRRDPCPRAVSLDGMAISAEAFRCWDGVLCTRVSPRKARPGAGSGAADEYMLWNPLTNGCAVVSAPAAGKGRIIGGYGHPVTGRFHLLHSSDVVLPGSRGLLVAPVTVRLLAVGDGGVSWREVPLPEPKTTTISMRREGDRSVSLHGNLHWLVQLTGSGNAAAALLVFDTAREEFRLMATPELRPELDPTTARSRVVPGGKLCVLALAEQSSLALEVWVLDDYSNTRSWMLRETVQLYGAGLSPTRFAAAAAVEVVEGAHEGELRHWGEEIFIQLGRHWIIAYSVRSKAWRQVSVGRSCAAPLLLYRESVLQPETSFGKALRVFRRGSVPSRRSRDRWFRRRSYPIGVLCLARPWLDKCMSEHALSTLRS
ncbi:unnamed protein product [Urochloa humidicola]